MPIPEDLSGRATTRLALALTLAPLAISALYLLFVVGADYHPSADLATTELRTRDVGQHMLWTGPFSRDGWYHPGPTLFFLLAGPYRLLGSSAAALSAAAVLLNAAAVAAMALLARRLGGLPLLLCTLVACSLLLHGLGPEFLRWPWNPYLTVLPYGVLLFLTAAMACGERWALPAASFVTSFLIQTHVGYLALALPLFVVGAAWLVITSVVARDDQGERTRRRIWPAGLLAAGIALVMWLPPLVQQLTHEDGNLSQIARYFREAGDTRDLADGARVVAAQYAWLPEWLMGEGPMTLLAEPGYLSTPLWPLLLLPVVVALVVLLRSRRVPSRALIAMWALGSLVGVLATARTIGPMYVYRLRWAWVLGAVGGLFLLWAAWTKLEARASQVLVPACIGALALMALVNTAAGVQAGTPTPRSSAMLRDLDALVSQRLVEGDGEVVVTSTGSFGALGYQSGLVLALERRGVAAKFPPAMEPAGPHRVHHGGSVRARLLVAVDHEIAQFADKPGVTQVAYVGRLPQEQLVAKAVEIAALEATPAVGEYEMIQRIVRTREVLPPESAVAVFDTTAAPG